MTQYNFILTIEVNDPDALFVHAFNHLVKQKGRPEEEAREWLMPDGEINTEACLTAVLDPGASPPGTEVITAEALFLCRAA